MKKSKTNKKRYSSSKLSAKYQIVIPKAVREKLGLKQGDEIKVLPLDRKHAVIVKRPASIVDEMYGLGANVWKSLGGTDKYLKEERDSWGDR